MIREVLNVSVPAVVHLRNRPNLLAQSGQAQPVTLDEENALLRVDSDKGTRAAGAHHLDRNKFSATEARFSRGGGFHTAPPRDEGKSQSNEIRRATRNVQPILVRKEQDPHLPQPLRFHNARLNDQRLVSFRGSRRRSTGCGPRLRNPPSPSRATPPWSVSREQLVDARMRLKKLTRPAEPHRSCSGGGSTSAWVVIAQRSGPSGRSCERGPVTAPVARFPARSGSQER